ncbi:MAG: tetratricopeptide repeat protein [Gammaproteobacteria bacterium]|nr:tetratricopeptide repeat protein [Gammaproteobacteria bacterium]
MEGNPDNIKKQLKQQLNENATDIEAAVMLGNYFYDLGDAAQAIIYYQHALNLNPNQPGVQTDMATMFWDNGDLGIAERHFREVIARYPDFANAYLNLGLLLFRGRQQLKEAALLWQELLERCPEHPAAEKARQLLSSHYQ